MEFSFLEILIIFLIGLLFFKETVLRWIARRLGFSSESNEQRFDSIDDKLHTIGENHLSHMEEHLRNIRSKQTATCRKLDTVNETLKDTQQRVITIQTDGVRYKNGHNK